MWLTRVCVCACMCAYQHLQQVGTFTVTAPTRRYLALEHTRGTHTDVSCLSFLWRRVPQVRLGFSFLDTGIHTCSGCEVSNGSVQHINAVSTFNDSCLFASPSSAAVPQRLGRQHNASTESSSAKAEAERDEDKHVGKPSHNVSRVRDNLSRCTRADLEARVSLVILLLAPQVGRAVGCMLCYKHLRLV